MFLPRDRRVGATHAVRKELIGTSDHAPLTAEIQVRQVIVANTKHTLPRESEEENRFLGSVAQTLKGIDTSTLTTPEALEEMSQALSEKVTEAWEEHAKHTRICTKSKGWWTERCTTTRDTWRSNRTPDKP